MNMQSRGVRPLANHEEYMNVIHYFANNKMKFIGERVQIKDAGGSKKEVMYHQNIIVNGFRYQDSRLNELLDNVPIRHHLGRGSMATLLLYTWNLCEYFKG